MKLQITITLQFIWAVLVTCMLERSSRSQNEIKSNDRHVNICLILKINQLRKVYEDSSEKYP